MKTATEVAKEMWSILPRNLSADAWITSIASELTAYAEEVARERVKEAVDNLESKLAKAREGLKTIVNEANPDPLPGPVCIHGLLRRKCDLCQCGDIAARTLKEIE